MTNRGLGKEALDRVLPLTITGVFVVAVLILLSHSTGAQGVDVRITELGCEGDPEVIVITNEGDQPVEMTGWNLQSDPVTRESLPLASFGALSPGQSIMVESGPSARGAFVWSQQFVFRDGDPTDFAQIASDAGEVLTKVNCPAAQPTPAATPTQTPPPAQTAAPAATPTVLSAAAAPVGGGPPGAAAGAIPPAAMIVAGSWLLSAGLGAFAIPLLYRRKPSGEPDPDPPDVSSAWIEPAVEKAESSEAQNPDTPAPMIAAQAHVHRQARPISTRSPGPPPIYLALVLVVLVLVVVLVFRLQGGKQRE